MDIVPNLETAAVDQLTTSKRKTDHLLTLEKITVKDLEDLNQPEREYLAERCTLIIQDLKGVARDKFLDRIAQIIPESTNSGIWEYNHSAISRAVSRFMQQYSTMPAIGAIADDTGLSRQTVAKHFREYKRHPGITAETERFKFMAPNLLASVFKFALKGDTKAARLYFEMTGELSARQNHTLVNKQNNYIQINNTILSQENLQNLSAEQLNQIESIVTNKVG